jgi:hypothetical protein
MFPARSDGRPQYYDIAPGDRVQCYHCLLAGLQSQYGHGEAFIADPANSPASILTPATERAKITEGVYTICKEHVPDNAVLYHPGRNECRSKDGQNTWVE